MARAEAASEAWVCTTPFGTPVLPLVGTTRASPSSTGRPPMRVLSWPVGSTKRPGERAARLVSTAGARQAGVDREHGVAPLPHPHQGVDERLAREGDRDELSHRRRG